MKIWQTCLGCACPKKSWDAHRRFLYKDPVRSRDPMRFWHGDLDQGLVEILVRRSCTGPCEILWRSDPTVVVKWFCPVVPPWRLQRL